MKILFFGLILIFSLIVGITTTSDSFAEKSKAYYIDKIEKTIPLIPQVNITKNDFDTSHEMDYPFARAWNDTMYVTYLDEEVTSAHDWWTGITLYRIGEINPISGTYEVDFNYWIQVFERNDTVNFQNNESFTIDFVNSAETPEIKVSKGIKHKSHYYDIRVNGVFYSDMDFTKFPFEKLNLKIKIEPGNIDAYDIKSDSVQFHRWPFPVLAEEGVPSPEYKIIDYKISTYNHTYSEGDTYSRYLAEFQIQRDYSGAFLKYLFPIIVMVGLAGAALIFPSEEYMTKIELNAIFLLGILFFVQVIVGEIPAAGGITIFDAVVILSYLVIMVTMGIPAAKWWKRRKFERDDEDYEEWKAKDRRMHDLHLEKEKRITERMTFLTSRINTEQNSEKVKSYNSEINELEKLRIQAITLKRIERDMRSVASAKNDEFEDRVKDNRKIGYLEKFEAKKEIIKRYEVKRKELQDIIKETEKTITNISNVEEDVKYNRDDIIKIDNIFDPKSYFDEEDDDQELKIVSWGYESTNKDMIKHNTKMNLLGLGLIILISGAGYAWIHSIFTG